MKSLEQVLHAMEQWLGELVEVREQLRAVEGVLGVNEVRAVLEERREAIEVQLRNVELDLQFHPRLRAGAGRICTA